MTDETMLTGQAAAEHDAGFVPMKDETAESETAELGKQEAAEKLAALGTMNNANVLTYATGLDSNETMTVDQAADFVNEQREAEKERAEASDIKATQNEVDEQRPQPEEPLAEDSESDLEKALAHPKIRAAIEQQAAEAETARHAHVSGLAAATQIAEQSFFSQFPEFTNVPPDQRVAVFAAIAQREPARAESIRAAVMQMGELVAQHGAESSKLAAEHETKTKEYVRAESERFEKMVAATPKAERVAIENGIVARIKEYGGDPEQFIKLMGKSEFSNATVQRLLWDVGRLHKIESAGRPTPSRAPIPRVQAPGTSVSRGERNTANLDSLNSKLSKSGNLKDATALLLAKRGKR
jgi:hypothetical protein